MCLFVCELHLFCSVSGYLVYNIIPITLTFSMGHTRKEVLTMEKGNHTQTDERKSIMFMMLVNGVVIRVLVYEIMTNNIIRRI